MKFKNAIKKAVKHKHKWVSIDIENEIYSYNKKPKFYKCGYWANDKADEQFIGTYTGKKNLTNSLKKLTLK